MWGRNLTVVTNLERENYGGRLALNCPSLSQVLRPERRSGWRGGFRVEVCEEIRREYNHGGGSIGGIAEKLGSHRSWCAKSWPLRIRGKKRSHFDRSLS
jgi:hypothetical protein